MKSQQKRTPAKKLKPNMSNDDLVITNIDDVVIDLGDVGADQETLVLNSHGTDTITIADLGYSSMNNTISLPISTAISGTSYTFNQGYLGTGTSAPVNIHSSGIDMSAGTDIKIDGKSLKEFMTKMEQRLSILVPDPAKLEKFQALKRAYEHYKTMESLCFDEPTE